MINHQYAFIYMGEVHGVPGNAQKKKKAQAFDSQGSDLHLPFRDNLLCHNGCSRDYKRNEHPKS